MAKFILKLAVTSILLALWARAQLASNAAPDTRGRYCKWIEGRSRGRESTVSAVRNRGRWQNRCEEM